VINTTVGTVKRFSEAVLSEAEQILEDDDASFGKKAVAATTVVPYYAVKTTTKAVTATTNFVANTATNVIKGLGNLF